MLKTMKRIFIIKWIVVLFVAGYLAGCSEDTGGDRYSFDKVFYVNDASLKLFFGDKQQLTASPTADEFEWSSEDTGIATVTANGLVEAVGVGTTNIVVTQGTVHKSIPVTVTIPSMNSATARAGKNRVQIEVNIKSDRIKGLRMVRLDNNESKEVDIDYQSGVFSFFYEGLTGANRYSFQLFCLDKFGNESEPVEVSANAYGDSYQATLQNAKIKAKTEFGNGIAIGWEGVPGAFYELFYTNRNGVLVSKVEPAGTENSYLIDYQSGSELSYSTLFLPEPSAIDTFRLPPVVVENITNKSNVFSIASPCEIQARDFDLGGEGVGYHDTDNVNQGGNYDYRRNLGDNNSPGVDIEGGSNLGYNNEGEWLMFTVKVVDAGNYALDLNLSVNNGDGGRYSLEVDGVKTAVYSLVNNDNWGDWRWYYERNPDVSRPAVLKLSQGIHKIKYTFESGGYNFMGLKFTYAE
ncbi:hypothetical protein AGMMS50239_39710 [Bacteroidia bacterium]|nr:hypothetical protein AGMMS50239_39710 [Bacteroidia bacterium]